MFSQVTIRIRQWRHMERSILEIYHWLSAKSLGLYWSHNMLRTTGFFHKSPNKPLDLLRQGSPKWRVNTEPSKTQYAIMEWAQVPGLTAMFEFHLLYFSLLALNLSHFSTKLWPLCDLQKYLTEGKNQVINGILLDLMCPTILMKKKEKYSTSPRCFQRSKCMG